MRSLNYNQQYLLSFVVFALCLIILRSITYSAHITSTTSFLFHGQKLKNLGSNSSKGTDGNELSLAHFPNRKRERRWRLSRMSQAMSQPQANGSELIKKLR